MFPVISGMCDSTTNENKFSEKKLILPALLKKYASIPKSIEKRVNKLLPGPYTIILNEKVNNMLSPLVNLDNQTLGIRMPKNAFILNLVEYINKPIITTSINVHNQASINDKDSLIKNFSKFDMFIDTFNNNSKG